MPVPTYDGSGEAVHPDVVMFPESWHGFRFWGAVTPYPNSAVQLENPSVLGSDDGIRWQVPAGMANPIAGTERGHLSDPDVIFDRATGELWMYYREVELTRRNRHIADRVWLTRSGDGRRWSVPVQLYADSGRYVVSPSVVQEPAGAFRLYAVDAGTGGCSARQTRLIMRQSPDGMRWDRARPVSFSQPGYLPWHLDVQYIASRGEYWALVAAYPRRAGCHASSLFLATSRDGLSWTTYPRPILAPSEYPAFSTTVYRSSFTVDAGNAVTIWFSGARQLQRGAKRRREVLSWSLATTRIPASALLSRVNDRSGSAALTIVSSAGPRTPDHLVP